MHPGLEVKAKGVKEDSDRSKIASRSLSSRSEQDNSRESYQSDDHYSTDQSDDHYSANQRDDHYSTDQSDDHYSTDQSDDHYSTDQSDDHYSTDQSDDHYSTDQSDDHYSTDQSDDHYSTDQSDDHYSTDQSDDHYSTDQSDDYYSTDIQPRTYVTPLFSSEQMMNTLASFVDLCRIAVDWNASLVEPHICGSRLYGLRGVRDHWCPSSEKMHPYRTFYDLEQLNDTLACTKPRRCGMAPYEDFLRYSHRQLVILHALSPTQFNHFNNLTEVNERSETVQSTLIQCNKAYSSLPVRVADILNARTKERNLSPFRTPTLLCWNKDAIVTTQSVLAAINSFMEPYSQNRFSVLFTTYSARQPEPGHDSFREKFASDAVVSRRCQPRLLHSAPSLRVLANAFLRDLGLKRGRFVSVHVSLCIHAHLIVVMSEVRSAQSMNKRPQTMQLSTRIIKSNIYSGLQNSCRECHLTHDSPLNLDPSLMC